MTFKSFLRGLATFALCLTGIGALYVLARTRRLREGQIGSKINNAGEQRIYRRPGWYTTLLPTNDTLHVRDLNGSDDIQFKGSYPTQIIRTKPFEVALTQAIGDQYNPGEREYQQIEPNSTYQINVTQERVVAKVDLREKTVPMDKIDFRTTNNVEMECSAIFSYQVENPRLVISFAKWGQAIQDFVRQAISRIYSRYHVNDLTAIESTDHRLDDHLSQSVLGKGEKTDITFAHSRPPQNLYSSHRVQCVDPVQVKQEALAAARVTIEKEFQRRGLQLNDLQVSDIEFKHEHVAKQYEDVTLSEQRAIVDARKAAAENKTSQLVAEQEARNTRIRAEADAHAIQLRAQAEAQATLSKARAHSQAFDLYQSPFAREMAATTQIVEGFGRNNVIFADPNHPFAATTTAAKAMAATNGFMEPSAAPQPRLAGIGSN